MKVHRNVTLPHRYPAALLTAAGAPLIIESRPTPQIAKGEVLVQIKASPINPSDLMMVAGLYPHKKVHPFVPGLEGSGLVVASGGGFMANYLLGKRVACSAPETGDGTWAAFMRVPAGHCIPLRNSVSDAAGASAIVNPLTALALIERIKKANSRSFVNTAAAGALGKMLIRLAQKEGLTAINVVRNPTQADELHRMGETEIINLIAPDAETLLVDAIGRHRPKILLDAIGGTFTDVLVKLAPANAMVVNYASLSREVLHINPAPLIRYGKSIVGFHLANWISLQSKFKMLVTAQKAQKLIASGMLEAPIAQCFSLEEINQALKNYQENMSAGKWLLQF